MIRGSFTLSPTCRSPMGASVNEGICADFVSLSYIVVDDVAEIVQRLGTASCLAKMDIEAASSGPLPPGNARDGKIYVDPCLPFGLRSAPKILNAVADTLCWCLQLAGICFVLHYLDIISSCHRLTPASVPGQYSI